jgi:predicted AAA+ superfamily ATPase
VFDIAGVDNVQNLRRVFELLRHKVGSPISYSAIARDIAVSSVTVKKYIQVLEALYLVFSIRPYTHKIARSILKEPKVYFYDTGLVLGDEGVRFENLVGVSLLKHVLFTQDMAGANVELAYLRTKNGHEVDFVVVDRDAQKPTLAVEAKHADHTLAPHLQYFLERYAIDAGVQVVQHIRHERQATPSIEIRDAYGFLSELS